jgi:hypothetical protein
MKLLTCLLLLVRAGAATDLIQIVLPKEGDTKITGRAVNAVSLQVNVFANADESAGKSATGLIQLADCAVSATPAAATPAPCLTAAGEFIVPLNKSLAAGQTVSVSGKDATGNAVGDTVSVPVASSVFDWGRVRAYFSGGTVIAKSGNEFSSPSTYLGLNVDYAWLQSDWHAKPESGGHALNTYFEARLTQVPATTGQALPDLSISANTILQSPQSGYVEAGVYAPFFFKSTRWQFRRRDNALFIAPLVKGGFQSVRGGSIDGLTVAQAQQAQIDSKDVYRFVAGGARIGHVQLPKGKGAAPELLSYIDVSAGRWDNLRVLKQDIQPVDGAGFRYPLRFDVEGRLKIPYAPFFVGFGLNVGSGADDLRFLFGTRFDIGQLLTTLVPKLQ